MFLWANIRKEAGFRKEWGRKGAAFFRLPRVEAVFPGFLRPLWRVTEAPLGVQVCFPAGRLVPPRECSCAGKRAQVGWPGKFGEAVGGRAAAVATDRRAAV